MTLEKKDSLVDSFLVRDLVISDLDEDKFIALPVLYTRTEIPVTKDDILTQEDADLWPHLGRVYLPNVSAEISLLIASDIPKALDPLKVKHSEHGGPYASRTHIGWVINGPLGRYHQGPHSTSFFVKADTELQQMVKNYYNLDFNESIADIRTELSQDERRFMTRRMSITRSPYHSKIDSIQFQTIASKQSSAHPGWRKGWRVFLVQSVCKESPS